MIQDGTAPVARAVTPTVRIGWVAICTLLIALWLPIGRSLWTEWRSTPSLSHGPLVPLIAAALLWGRRDALREWRSASPAGLCALIGCALVAVAAVWADVEFLKALALIGVMVATLWFLGGSSVAAAGAGPLGFLVFMIPWPTVLVDRVGFPLQLMSSAYATLIGGLAGVPVVRDGIQIAVVPNAGAPPIYTMVVAQACSGMTSLLVLLTLGYLVAYHTNVGLAWRALMVVAVVPLALITNATRLTFVLLAGAHHRPELAQWIHDHEGPVLILVCSLLLLGLRAGLIKALEACRTAPPALDGALD